MMSQQSEQEQALKSDIDQEGAENCTEEELSAITGGSSEQAKQGAATGAVTGMWAGAAAGAFAGAKNFGPGPLVPKLDVMARWGGAGAVGGTLLGAAVGSSVGATLPARHK